MHHGIQKYSYYTTRYDIMGCRTSELKYIQCCAGSASNETLHRLLHPSLQWYSHPYRTLSASNAYNEHTDLLYTSDTLSCRNKHLGANLIHIHTTESK